MQTVIGLFDTARDAEQAVQKLKNNGFTSDNIDVSIKDGSRLSGSQTYGNTLSDDDDDSIDDNRMTGTSSDTTMGSASGVTGMTGSTTGLTSTTGNRGRYDHDHDDDSVGDKVSRFFKNLFGGDDNDEASRYSHVANKVDCVVTVHAQSGEEARRASEILDEYGAVDVDERASQYGYSRNSGTMSNVVTNENSDTMSNVVANENSDTRSNVVANEIDSDDTLKVIKEDVQVGKREVDTGGVRIRSRIVERPVEEQLRLREERVTVQRNPVDRPATAADLQNFKEGEIEMRESAEVADVTKQARVVEEVKLSKDVDERVETVRETARDTQVDVENLEDTNVSGRKNKKKNI